MQIVNRKSKIENRRGFTLAEMLIVIAITLILLGIGSRVYYDQKDKFVYNDALSKIMEIIKTARNSAITNRMVPSGNTNIVPVNGYGVYINLEPGTTEPHFTFFASLGNDNDSSTYNKKFDAKTDYIIETYRLPKQIQLQYFVFDEGKGKGREVKFYNQSATEKNAVIIFRPPLAETYLGDNSTKELKELEELSMRFYNNTAPADSSKRCQYIRINRIKTFPYIEYTNCNEYQI